MRLFMSIAESTNNPIASYHFPMWDNVPEDLIFHRFERDHKAMAQAIRNYTESDSKISSRLRESSRGSTIASRPIFLIWNDLRSSNPEGFDAAWNQFLNHFRYT